MTAPIALLALIAGLYVLIKGADWLVDGASSLARRIGISDLVIGLTIVSFGTSMPELIVNILASFSGSADLAIGNIVGSNISNTLFIIGAAAMVGGLKVRRTTVIKEIPFCLLASILLLVMANDAFVDAYAVSELGRSDGIAFLAFFVIFLYYTFGIRHRSDSDEGYTKPKFSIGMAILLILGGLTGLSIGGKLTVDGAIAIANAFGLSEGLIGLTVVAIGTSLPELATSVVAARKGNADIAVGNIIGSNIFNIFWILGISALIRPLPFQSALNFDLLEVVLSVLILFFFVHTGRIYHRLRFWNQRDSYIISRIEGAVMVTLYIAYLVVVVWRG